MNTLEEAKRTAPRLQFTGECQFIYQQDERYVVARVVLAGDVSAITTFAGYPVVSHRCWCATCYAVDQQGAWHDR